ncbi:hypothetical protein [Brucella sp. 191011898]|uniref:hypothetical protein n=1 Tax=Brucella sp. 191011898 TaxID=2730447 RepID=UPI0015DDAAA0|nr:hypothetical protein BCH_02749 [Brucella sp. 191011898]
MSKTTNKFSPEVGEPAVRLVFDNEGLHGSLVLAGDRVDCGEDRRFGHTLNELVKITASSRLGLSPKSLTKPLQQSPVRKLKRRHRNQPGGLISLHRRFPLLGGML